MPMVAPRYTIADLDRFPDDGNRYELLGGVLLVTPAPGPPHQVVLGRLNVALAGFLGSADAAVILTPGVIQVGRDTQLEPDLLVIPAAEADRTRWYQMRDWWLAVEVSGPSSTIYDRDFKTAAYLQAGVREVWRVDLRARTVYGSVRGGALDVPHIERLSWQPPGLSRTLEIELRTIFRSS